MRLQGKTAFCTASGAGIGLATVRAFAREGARVIATDISAAALEPLAAEGFETHALDVTDGAAVTALNNNKGLALVADAAGGLEEVIKKVGR
jgi:2-keto-3-deoxy-L-fuconate dehydrogenase